MNNNSNSQQSSIGKKLTLLIVVVSTVTLLLAASLFTLYQIRDYQLTLAENLTTVAKITGDNTNASIAFDNADDATNILSDLENDPRITVAAIYTTDNKLFASYNAKPEIAPVFEPLEDDGYLFKSGKLHLSQTIYLEETSEVIGKIYLQANMNLLHKHIYKNIFITGFIVLFSLFICYFLSLRFQKLISSPILELSRATDTIKTDKDYSVRVKRDDYLEIKHLCDGFNSMLEEIQTRDDHLQQLASYDPLTGLANRNYFSDILSNAISSGMRKSRKHAILFLDLDRFKHINDSLGHSIGDDLLIQVARRLELIIRDEDVVARLGGDEFTVLLQEVTDSNQAAEVAERILIILDEPFNLRGHNVVIKPSIGIVMYPEHGQTAEQLIQNADTAMYQSKHAGGDNFRFFSEHMNVNAQRRLRLEEELRQAIHKDEIIVHYQPQFDLSTQSIINIEALVRWNKSKEKMIPPNEFLPLADETGLIYPLGNIIFKQAFTTLKKLNEDGLYNHKLSINMSPKQFRHASSIEPMLTFMEELGINPNQIEIEITEEALIDYSDELITVMHTLKEHGISLAIDDFGTGYSSLSYLKQFPFDTLKIDRTFVHDINDTENNSNIVRAIIDMSHHLDLKVVAEGVESKTQVQLLRDMGCDIIQGYYIGKPMDEKQFRLYLLQHASSNKLKCV